MTQSNARAEQPKGVIQIHPVGSSATFGLLLLVISAVTVSTARSISPVRLKVQDIDGVEGLYGASGAEYFWTAIGAVIGFVGVAFVAVAVIAKGIELGRR